MAVIYTDKKADLPERAEKDFYQTPQAVIDAAMERFGQRRARVILDIGAGNDGRWGISAANYADDPLCLVGVDIRKLPEPSGFTWWHTMDYSKPIECELMSVKRFDFIVSNPPFYCAEAIIWNAWSQLKKEGSMLFLLPSDFWYSIGRFRGLWRELPPKNVCSIVNRIPFTGDGNPNNYDLYFWRKDAEGLPVGKPNETVNTQIMF
jgi:hypothetical protein